MTVICSLAVRVLWVAVTTTTTSNFRFSSATNYSATDKQPATRWNRNISVTLAVYHLYMVNFFGAVHGVPVFF